MNCYYKRTIRKEQRYDILNRVYIIIINSLNVFEPLDFGWSYFLFQDREKLTQINFISEEIERAFYIKVSTIAFSFIIFFPDVVISTGMAYNV